MTFDLTFDLVSMIVVGLFAMAAYWLAMRRQDR